MMIFCVFRVPFHELQEIFFLFSFHQHINASEITYDNSKFSLLFFILIDKYWNWPLFQEKYICQVGA